MKLNQFCLEYERASILWWKFDAHEYIYNVLEPLAVPYIPLPDFSDYKVTVFPGQLGLLICHSLNMYWIRGLIMDLRRQKLHILHIAWNQFFKKWITMPQRVEACFNTRMATTGY